MIATIVMTDDGPMLPLPEGALAALRLRTGQRVRVDLQPLPSPYLYGTPRLEPDGTPA